ncbi:hypothetical protein DRA42_12215 [Ethanoligenens harbinense]|nr:hypothetical protein CXQ68_12180 [Ethanoligenens harbinense YUAN-3]AYF39558.1 hypothetical protein CXP51_12075 [Ethanoligenens harbinense]AYF42384.1 hypothetical protein CN246_12625 [Ethanoligenens harbinense]QCN93137.1 hypothetical protein DRA42_12215 [Ethanoligenens harbinense]
MKMRKFSLKNAKRYFGSINIWLLSFIPLSFIYNVLFTGMIAPYPLIVSSAIVFPAPQHNCLPGTL